MEKNKTISVWLTIIDGRNKGKIILQKRSLQNKTFAFVCQATWAGKIEIGEDINKAVKRECKEELGDEFYNKFDFSILVLKSKNIYTMKDKEWEVYNLAGTIKEEVLKTARLHKEALPEFIFVDKNSMVYPLNSNKNSKNNIVLFDDQYKVLKEIINGN